MLSWRIWWRSGRVQCGRRSQPCVGASSLLKNPPKQAVERARQGDRRMLALRTRTVRCPCRMGFPGRSLHQHTDFLDQINVDQNSREEFPPLKSLKIRNLSVRPLWWKRPAAFRFLAFAQSQRDWWLWRVGNSKVRSVPLTVVSDPCRQARQRAPHHCDPKPSLSAPQARAKQISARLPDFHSQRLQTRTEDRRPEQAIVAKILSLPMSASILGFMFLTFVDLLVVRFVGLNALIWAFSLRLNLGLCISDL